MIGYWITDHSVWLLIGAVAIALAVGIWLVAHFGGALFPATGSCQYYHYHDYVTYSISNGMTTEQFHHQYVCDKYYPLPTESPA